MSFAALIIAGCYWLDFVILGFLFSNILGSLTFQFWSTYSPAGTSQWPVALHICVAEFPKLLRFSSSFSLCGSGGTPRERLPPLGDDPLSHWSLMLSGDVRAWKIVSLMRFWVRVLILVVAFPIKKKDRKSRAQRILQPPPAGGVELIWIIGAHWPRRSLDDGVSFWQTDCWEFACCDHLSPLFPIVYLQGNPYRFHTSRPNEFSIDVLTMRNKFCHKHSTLHSWMTDFCSFHFCAGGKLRATAATGVHDQSSRSHAWLANDDASN